MGKFELAEPLQTENFRDSWDVLKEVSCLQCNDITCILLITNHIISLCLIQRLKDTPKDTPIMTYCTVGNIYQLTDLLSECQHTDELFAIINRVEFDVSKSMPT